MDPTIPEQMEVFNSLFNSVWMQRGQRDQVMKHIRVGGHGIEDMGDTDSRGKERVRGHTKVNDVMRSAATVDKQGAGATREDRDRDGDGSSVGSDASLGSGTAGARSRSTAGRSRRGGGLSRGVGMEFTVFKAGKKVVVRVWRKRDNHDEEADEHYPNEFNGGDTRPRGGVHCQGFVVHEAELQQIALGAAEVFINQESRPEALVRSMDRISLVCEYMLPRVVLVPTTGSVLAQAPIPDPPESTKRPSSRARLQFNSEREKHHQARKEALAAARSRLRAARAAAVPKYYIASLPNLKHLRDSILEADIRQQCARKLQVSVEFCTTK